VFVENRLFATLDSTTRQLVSPERDVALLTDTVGFIRKLPHHLVASFHSTLVEAIEADILLHVTDASDPDFVRHITAVDTVLDKILKEPRPPRIMVFNKSDLLSEDQAASLRVTYPDCLIVSSLDGDGLDTLRADIFARAKSHAQQQRAPQAHAEPDPAEGWKP
jgi:GTP-binding protein HflX